VPREGEGGQPSARAGYSQQSRHRTDGVKGTVPVTLHQGQGARQFAATSAQREHETGHESRPLRSRHRPGRVHRASRTAKQVKLSEHADGTIGHTRAGGPLMIRPTAVPPLVFLVDSGASMC